MPSSASALLMWGNLTPFAGTLPLAGAAGENIVWLFDLGERWEEVSRGEGGEENI